MLRACILILASGCATLGGPDAKCQEIPIELLVEGGKMLNVNVEGQSLPVEVRAYFLKDRDTIERLDFDSVWQKDDATLGPAVTAKTSFTVFPGEEKITTLSVPAATSYVAVVALFRQIEGEQWRRVIDVSGIVDRCKPGDLHFPVRASLQDNRVIAQERAE